MVVKHIELYISIYFLLYKKQLFVPLKKMLDIYRLKCHLEMQITICLLDSEEI